MLATAGATAGCDPNGNQMEIDACALDSMYAANKALNAEVLKRWQESDALGRRLLEIAEARWWAAAKAYCDWAVDANRGGSIIGATWPTCMADMAAQQRRLLTTRDGIGTP
jgi:uncharacterized protein YecT (DUF1311 family)